MVHVIGAYQKQNHVLTVKSTTKTEPQKNTAIPMVENVFGSQMKVNAFQRDGWNTNNSSLTKNVQVILMFGDICYYFLEITISTLIYKSFEFDLVLSFDI